jgi:SAM-dependent MidA family methyltransferase
MPIADHSRNELPQPSPEAQAHSNRLRAHIARDIRQAGGQISFAEFMQLALYAPGLGYYSAGALKLGAQGDFTTAPELSPLFSRCLARQCAQVLQTMTHADLLEVGAGSGIMAADILAELEQLNSLPHAYFILELSAELRQRQQQTIKLHVPHLYNRVHWLDALPGPGFQGLVLGNEVLDAMPVQRFVMVQGQVFEVTVSNGDDGQFAWSQIPADKAVEAAVRHLEQQRGETFADGYNSEINLAAQAWMTSIAAIVQQGVVLLVDYGFPAHEFYHAQRSMGTLMCHYRHRAHGDPFLYVGLQDITAHVDFTAMAEAADKAGLEVAGFTTQAHFLLGLGIEQFVGEAEDTMKLAQQLKQLVLPSEMGELFKVIAFSRGVEVPLEGFSLQDHRSRL